MEPLHLASLATHIGAGTPDALWPLAGLAVIAWSFWRLAHPRLTAQAQ
jgi:hypothetical protein